MRLISIHIDNFGRLSNVDLKFEPGLNTILWENGTGKSTLAAFIKVMLYGFEADGTNAKVREREVYRPWQGGAYGGSITFETEGREYVAYKRFGAVKKDDDYKLIDYRTNLASKDYSDNLGEEIFLLDKQSFLNSVCISQNDCMSTLTDGIQARISNISDVDGDVDRYDNADKKLKDYINGNSFTKKKAKGRLLNEDVERLRADLMEYVHVEDKLENKETELHDYEVRLDRIKAETDRYNQLSGEAQGRSLTDEQLRRLEELERGEAGSHSAEEVEAMIADKNRADQTHGRWALTMFAAAAVGAVASVALFVMQLIIPAVIAAVAALIMLVAGVLIKSNKSDTEKLYRLKSQCLEYESLKNSYDRYQEAVYKLEEIKKNGVKSSDYEECQNAIRSAQRSIEALNADIIKRDDLEARLEEQLQAVRDLERKVRLCTEARNMLETAKNNFTNYYTEPVLNSFTRFVQMMGHTSTFTMDAKMNVHRQEAGMPRDVNTQSAGIKDLYGVALRLSFAEAMFTDEKSFVIMDDPFANMDDDRMSHARDFVRELSGEYQIIYFTCSQSRNI